MQNIIAEFYKHMHIFTYCAFSSRHQLGKSIICFATALILTNLLDLTKHKKKKKFKILIFLLPV